MSEKKFLAVLANNVRPPDLDHTVSFSAALLLGEIISVMLCHTRDLRSRMSVADTPTRMQMAGPARRGNSDRGDNEEFGDVHDAPE